MSLTNISNTMPSDIELEVVFAMPDQQPRETLKIPTGTRARDAVLQIRDSRLLALLDDAGLGNLHAVPLGVFGQIIGDDYVLEQGDRLEIYRPLIQDPKERRRKIAQSKS